MRARRDPRAWAQVPTSLSVAERYLARGESVVLVVRRHYMVLWKPSLVTCIVVLGSLAVGSAADPRSASDPVDTVVGVAVLLFVAWFMYCLLAWRVDRIYVTDHRLFEVSGVFTRNVASMPLSKMTDMTYRQTFLGWLLGYGEMIVETAGQDQALSHIKHVPQPRDFYKKVVTLVTTGLHELKLTVEDDPAQVVADPPDIEEHPVHLPTVEEAARYPEREGPEEDGGRSGEERKGGDDGDTGPIPRVRPHDPPP
ncbi:hypothetical protein BH18ACT15_BH18ACT15_02100 [soil metagenome]